MNELMKKTEFLQWSTKNDFVIAEFTQKAKVYNDYHEKVDFYEDLFSILEREITLPFLQWFERFKLVIDEFKGNLL